MTESAMGHAKARFRITRVAWVLAGAVCLFAAENVWIDPWMARRYICVIDLYPWTLLMSWTVTW